jgi:hypothetical protein
MGAKRRNETKGKPGTRAPPVVFTVLFTVLELGAKPPLARIPETASVATLAERCENLRDSLGSDWKFVIPSRWSQGLELLAVLEIRIQSKSIVENEWTFARSRSRHELMLKFVAR